MTPPELVEVLQELATVTPIVGASKGAEKFAVTAVVRRCAHGWRPKAEPGVGSPILVQWFFVSLSKMGVTPA